MELTLSNGLAQVTMDIEEAERINTDAQEEFRSALNQVD